MKLSTIITNTETTVYKVFLLLKRFLVVWGGEGGATHIWGATHIQGCLVKTFFFNFYLTPKGGHTLRWHLCFIYKFVFYI